MPFAGEKTNVRCVLSAANSVGLGEEHAVATRFPTGFEKEIRSQPEAVVGCAGKENVAFKIGDEGKSHEGPRVCRGGGSDPAAAAVTAETRALDIYVWQARDNGACLEKP